jgi:hypothetical protein
MVKESTMCAIQDFMATIRGYHNAQANWLEKNKEPVDESVSFEERFEHAKYLFYTKYKFEDLTEDSLTDLFQFIINYRVVTKSTNNEYHSRPRSLKRFCECENTECKLFYYFGWCDFYHEKDVQPGDIVIIGESKESKSSELVMIVERVHDWKINAIKLSTTSCHGADNFLSQVLFPKELEKFKQSLSGVSCVITNSALKEETSRFVASLQDMQLYFQRDLQVKDLQVKDLLSLNINSLLCNPAFF